MILDVSVFRRVQSLVRLSAMHRWHTRYIYSFSSLYFYSGKQDPKGRRCHCLDIAPHSLLPNAERLGQMLKYSKIYISVKAKIKSCLLSVKMLHVRKSCHSFLQFLRILSCTFQITHNWGFQWPRQVSLVGHKQIESCEEQFTLS